MPSDARPPLALPGMRVGLLGGSFNPAHEGHLHISLTALRRLGLDRLWWMVTPGNPLKRPGDLASLPERVAQARTLAVHPDIVVTDFEAALPTPYAIDTVHFLQKRYPGVHFVWIMGGDNLAQFHLWRDWTGLFGAIPILVLDRPGARNSALAAPAARRFASARLPESAAAGLALAQPPAWIYLTLPLSDLSSTAIRKAGNAKKRGI
ncbi:MULTISPECIES: nicotinate-nucleotide adenylyltransferase [Rhodomicrobium]|uniref:nicotinate-nucleotide adenylyltransferase n=1 Tax=Rhodomicrobium TaxID=1068 RepID=UPI000B4A774E|nr:MULTISPECIES: nicotinate-nucleotide adenylyltransferase [Rhodomicrobium]